MHVMISQPDCVVCLLKQYLQISRLCGLDEKQISDNFSDLLKEIPSLADKQSPPELAAYFTRMIEKASGISDPYKEIKIASNTGAMKLYPELKERVEQAANPFAEALCLAIAGNLIDFGAKTTLNLHDALREILTQPMFQHIETGGDFDEAMFQLKSFHRELESAENIIYLGDNAGEIVFDRVFIETLLNDFPGKKITFVVRGGPALNDVLIEDASDIGLDKIVDVMSSGTATAGTVLPNCTPEFLEKLHSSDLVISKGQGNYEALFGESLPPTWFLFRIKCETVARMAGGSEGTLVLIKNKC